MYNIRISRSISKLERKIHGSGYARPLHLYIYIDVHFEREKECRGPIGNRSNRDLYRLIKEGTTSTNGRQRLLFIGHLDQRCSHAPFHGL